MPVARITYPGPARNLNGGIEKLVNWPAAGHQQTVRLASKLTYIRVSNFTAFRRKIACDLGLKRSFRSKKLEDRA